MEILVYRNVWILFVVMTIFTIMRLFGEKGKAMLYEIVNSDDGGLFITSLAVFLVILTETFIANSFRQQF